MRIFLILLLFVPMFAWAANTPPPGDDTDLIYNNAGRYGNYGIGTGLSVTTTGGKKYLNSTGSPTPTTSIIEENGSPILTEAGQNIVEE